MTRNPLTQKLLILGVDGMDPRIARRFMEEGLMPNLQQYIQRGACREDLVLLGAHPTITPPMWTTLATGAYAETHGVTCFWKHSPHSLEEVLYNFDSTNCQAEQLWNVTAEAGKKTLVWHWPGSSWPPTSANPHLHVVDGTSPGGVTMGSGTVDKEKILYASASIDQVLFKGGATANSTGAGCILNDLDLEDQVNNLESMVGSAVMTNIMLKLEDGEFATEILASDLANSPLKEAQGWADAPEGAKEFYLVVSKGLVRRPCLLLKNAEGNYDHFEVYKNKNQKECLACITNGELGNYFDVAIKGEETIPCYRELNILEVDPKGQFIKIWISNAISTRPEDQLFHPHDLYTKVCEHISPAPPTGNVGGVDPQLVEKALLPCWAHYTRWQDQVLNDLIASEDYDVVFSHLHNVDIIGHMILRFNHLRAEHPDLDPLQYDRWMGEVYADTDRYLGEFLHLLDKGWTIFIVSDHGLVSSFEEFPPLLGDPYGINAGVMMELGYTVLQKDDNGQPLKAIDWSKTRAVASRGNYIWINLKGRNATGIVNEAERYELERQIIDDLYSYRDAKTNKRVVSLAMRNKEAAILGLSGAETGDIIYFTEEGFNRVHGDCLTTTYGYGQTSVSPIFIAAGQGIKSGFKTSRVIRQVDVAPTAALLCGVRMPKQCEGAPAYQILSEEY